MNFDFDVVIIGAGVCGALCACELAKNGKLKVLILDCGSDEHDPAKRQSFLKSFDESKDKSTISPYLSPNKDDGLSLRALFAPSPDLDDAKIGERAYFLQLGKDVFKSNYQRMVGGSTWSWRGNVPRYVPSDFEMLSRYGVGVDWPLAYHELEPFYCLAEEEIGVAGNHDEWDGLHGAFRSKPFPMPEIVPSYGDGVVKRRLGDYKLDGRAVEVLTTPQARNSQPYRGRSACVGHANCIPLCPTDAKYDASIHVREALKLGVTLRSRCVATELSANAAGRIREVRFIDWGKDPSRIETVSARIVVLAANALESAKLLLLSNLANSSDQVGRNLMDHPAADVVGSMPEPVYPYRGPQNTSGIEAFRDGDSRRVSGAFRMTVGNDGGGRTKSPYTILEEGLAVGLMGPKLRDYVRERSIRLQRISCSTEQRPLAKNRMTLSRRRDALGIPCPQLEYELDDYSLSAIERGKATAAKILQYMGAEGLQATSGYSGAGHVMGTLRMGLDPRVSVVDRYGRSHDNPNLFAVGAAVFPTSSTGNPTLTAAALTLWTAREICRS